MSDGTFQKFSGEAMGNALSAESVAKANNAREQQRQQFEMQKMQYEQDRLDQRQMLRNEGKQGTQSNEQNLAKLQQQQEQMEAQRKEEQQAKATANQIALNDAYNKIMSGDFSPQAVYNINKAASTSIFTEAIYPQVNEAAKARGIKEEDLKMMNTFDLSNTTDQFIKLLATSTIDPNNEKAQILMNGGVGIKAFEENNTIPGKLLNFITTGQLLTEFSMKSTNGKDQFGDYQALFYACQNLSQGKLLTVNDVKNANFNIPGDKTRYDLGDAFISLMHGEGAKDKYTKDIQNALDKHLKGYQTGLADFDQQIQDKQTQIDELNNKLAEPVKKFESSIKELETNMATGMDAINAKTTEIDALTAKEQKEQLTEEESLKLSTLQSELEILNKEYHDNKKALENTQREYETAKELASNTADTEWYSDFSSEEAKQMQQLKEELRALESARKDFNKGHDNVSKELNEQYKQVNDFLLESAVKKANIDPEIKEICTAAGANYGAFDKNGDFIGVNILNANLLNANTLEARQAQEKALLNYTLETQKQLAELAKLRDVEAQHNSSTAYHQGYGATAQERGLKQGGLELLSQERQAQELAQSGELSAQTHQRNMIAGDTALQTAAANNQLQAQAHSLMAQGKTDEAQPLVEMQATMARMDHQAGGAGSAGMNPPAPTEEVVYGGQLQSSGQGQPSGQSTPSGQPTKQNTSRSPQIPMNTYSDGEIGKIEREEDLTKYYNIIKSAKPNEQAAMASSVFNNALEYAKQNGMSLEELKQRSPKFKAMLDEIETITINNLDRSEKNTIETLSGSAKILSELSHEIKHLGSNLLSEGIFSVSDKLGKHWGAGSSASVRANRASALGRIEQYNANKKRINEFKEVGGGSVYQAKGTENISDIPVDLSSQGAVIDAAVRSATQLISVQEAYLQNTTGYVRYKLEKELAETKVALQNFKNLGIAADAVDLKFAFNTGNEVFYDKDGEIFRVKDGKAVQLKPNQVMTELGNHKGAPEWKVELDSARSKIKAKK